MSQIARVNGLLEKLREHMTASEPTSADQQRLLFKWINSADDVESSELWSQLQQIDGEERGPKTIEQMAWAKEFGVTA